MDGNGRWAASQGLPRWAGHSAGVRTVRRIVEAAPGLGVGVLTLYAFSSDNWKRPPDEVRFLMHLLERYLADEATACRDRGVRINVIGRRDRLDERIVRAIERAEAETAGASRLLLRVAIDYSARRAITLAAADVEPGVGEDDFTRAIERATHSVAGVQPVDLVVRTSGEMRLSDFLLWESAYAELHFTPKPWPAFRAADLGDAIEEFYRRERRFGALPNPGPTPARAGGAT